MHNATMIRAGLFIVGVWLVLQVLGPLALALCVLAVPLMAVVIGVGLPLLLLGLVLLAIAAPVLVPLLLVLIVLRSTERNEYPRRDALSA